MIFAAIFYFIGYVFAQQSSIHHTLNISKCSHTVEPKFSSLRVIVTVILEEVAYPGNSTVSSLSRAPNLEVSRRVDLSPTIHDSPTLASLISRPNHNSGYSLSPCAASDTAICRHWKPPSQSAPPHSTSRANLMEFTGSATRSELRSIYLLLAISIRILRI